MNTKISKALKKDSIFLNVLVQPYDKPKAPIDVLTDMRKLFFTEHKKQKNKLCFTINEEQLRYTYNMKANGTLKWEVRKNNEIIERSYTESAGYIIENSEKLGIMSKKMFFNHNHIWQKTEYFTLNSSNTPTYTLLPWMNDDRAAIAKYTGNESIPEILFSLPMLDNPKYLKEMILKVKPKIKAFTNNGFSYFGTEEEENQWLKLVHEFKESEVKKQPDEPVDEQKQKIYFNISATDNLQLVQKSMFVKDKSPEKPKKETESIQKKVTKAKEEVTADAPSTAKPNNKSTKDKGSLNAEAEQVSKPVIKSDNKATKRAEELEFEQLSLFELESVINQAEKDAVDLELDSIDVDALLEELDIYSGALTIDSNIHTETKNELKYSTNLKITENDNTGTLFIAKQKDGKSIDIGTLIDKEGNLIYYGEMKEGKKEGKGVLYCSNGDILYKGTFKNNLYNGAGRLYLEDGSIIDGAFMHGKVDGQASKRDSFGTLVYTGAWQNNLYHGHGTVYYKDHRFTGEFFRGQPFGKGVIHYSNGTMVTGTFAKEESEKTSTVSINSVTYFML